MNTSSTFNYVQLNPFVIIEHRQITLPCRHTLPMLVCLCMSKQLGVIYKLEELLLPPNRTLEIQCYQPLELITPKTNATPVLLSWLSPKKTTWRRLCPKVQRTNCRDPLEKKKNTSSKEEEGSEYVEYG